MANSITGDYDVVIQLSFDALNRLLAALHVANQEIHSTVWTINPPPSTLPYHPPVRVQKYDRPVSSPAPVTGTQTGGITQVPTPEVVAPSGRVEIQVSTPSLTVPETEDTSKVTVHQKIMTHFIATPDSTPMPEFTHGELQLTVSLSPNATPGGNTLTVDLTKNVQASFNPIWTSSPLDRLQKAWINQYVLEALKNGIKPINITLPQPLQQVRALDIKFIRIPPPQSPALAPAVAQAEATLTGTSAQVDQIGAVLLSVTPNAPTNPDPATVSTDLVNGLVWPYLNDFAVAVSNDFINYLITSQNLIPTPPGLQVNWNVSFNLGLLTAFQTVHETITYNLSFNPITLTLGSGQITLTVTGSAQSPSNFLGINFPSTNFTITQNVALQLLNSIVSLNPVGDPQISLSNQLLTTIGDITGALSGGILSQIKQQIAQQLSQAQQTVQSMLSNPTQSVAQSISSTLHIPPLSLRFTALTVTSDGIVVVGSIAVPYIANLLLGPISNPTPVNVEFTQGIIPPPISGGGSGPGLRGGAVGPILALPQTQLNALGSWIPGGTITKFVWSLKSSPNDPNPTVMTEQHEFVLNVSSDIPTEYVCLTVEGTQVAEFGLSGVVSVLNSVSGQKCINNVTAQIPMVPFPIGVKGLLPITVVTNSGGRPQKPVVIANLNPWSSDANTIANETIIHFPEPSAIERDLSTLRETLLREKAAALVIVVLPHEQADKIGHIELPNNYYLGWVDDQESSWRRAFKATKGPATVILDRSGKEVWHEDGQTSASNLKTALKQYLSPGLILSNRENLTALKVGKKAPDFIFEYSGTKRMALSNFSGRPVTLIFWASWSEPSLEELEYLQNIQNKFKDLVILAVNDADTREKAEQTLKKHRITFPLIMDQQRQIAELYAIECWPTIISVNAKGVISNINLGITEKPSLPMTSSIPSKLR